MSREKFEALMLMSLNSIGAQLQVITAKMGGEDTTIMEIACGQVGAALLKMIDAEYEDVMYVLEKEAGVSEKE